MVSVAEQLRQRAQVLLRRIPSAVSAPTFSVAFSVPLPFPVPRRNGVHGRLALRPAPALATLQLSVTGATWPPLPAAPRPAPLSLRPPAKPGSAGARQRNLPVPIRRATAAGTGAAITAAAFLPRRLRRATDNGGEWRLAPGRQRLPEHPPRSASRSRLAVAGSGHVGGRFAEVIARYRASLATWILA